MIVQVTFRMLLVITTIDGSVSTNLQMGDLCVTRYYNSNSLSFGGKKKSYGNKTCLIQKTYISNIDENLSFQD